jgi:hypothetical protein
MLEPRHRISVQRRSPPPNAITPHNDNSFKGFSTASTPQISDAPMRVTQNKFMVGARSLHLLVRRMRHKEPTRHLCVLRFSPAAMASL